MSCAWRWEACVTCNDELQRIAAEGSRAISSPADVLLGVKPTSTLCHHAQPRVKPGSLLTTWGMTHQWKGIMCKDVQTTPKRRGKQEKKERARNVEEQTQFTYRAKRHQPTLLVYIDYWRLLTRFLQVKQPTLFDLNTQNGPDTSASTPRVGTST